MHENLYIICVYSSCKKACYVEPYKLSDTYRSHWTITVCKSTEHSHLCPTLSRHHASLTFHHLPSVLSHIHSRPYSLKPS